MARVKITKRKSEQAAIPPDTPDNNPSEWNELQMRNFLARYVDNDFITVIMHQRPSVRKKICRDVWLLKLNA
jgi:hypothetical protein